MKRFSILALAVLLLLCTGCVGRAAAPAEPPRAESLDAAAAPESAPESPEEPEPPEELEEPEEPWVRVIDPAGPMVALTFDDGPDEVYSNAILDVLEENHALATFFEVGRNVLACPEPVKRMADMGCEVASHSNAHKDLSKLKKAPLLRDLDAADEAFAAAGVDAPLLVRPPYGAVNKTVKSATGRTMITWTVDTEDWRSRDAQEIVEFVQNYGDLDGEIILMHSIYESTAEAAAILVPWLQEQGYQLVTVTELMAFYYGELPQPDQFYGYTYFTTHGRTDAPVELPSMFPPEEPEEAAVEPLPEEPADAPVEVPAEEPVSAEPVPAVQVPAPEAAEGGAAVPQPGPAAAAAAPKRDLPAPRGNSGSGASIPNPALFNYGN